MIYYKDENATLYDNKYHIGRKLQFILKSKLILMLNKVDELYSKDFLLYSLNKNVPK